jgi:hypothetical protein
LILVVTIMHCDGAESGRRAVLARPADWLGGGYDPRDRHHLCDRCKQENGNNRYIFSIVRAGVPDIFLYSGMPVIAPGVFMRRANGWWAERLRRQASTARSIIFWGI